MEASDRIITELVDAICRYRWTSNTLRKFQFRLDYQRMMRECADIYTENEMRIIEDRIRAYPFKDFILTCKNEKKSITCC
jgi:hypothetical protein